MEQALNELRENGERRGVILLKKGDEYQLGTDPEHAPYIERMIQHEFSESLSKQALETLAVIAYQGPLSKTDIDYIRGINSAFILRTLLVRGLIERADNTSDARSYAYQISFDFLKHFGLQSPEELPRYHEFKTHAADLQNKP